MIEVIACYSDSSLVPVEIKNTGIRRCIVHVGIGYNCTVLNRKVFTNDLNGLVDFCLGHNLHASDGRIVAKDSNQILSCPITIFCLHGAVNRGLCLGGIGNGSSVGIHTLDGDSICSNGQIPASLALYCCSIGWIKVIFTGQY